MRDVSEPLLELSTFEALGSNTKELLAAAVDRMGTSVDLSALLPRQNFPEVKLAQILSQGLYHHEKGFMSENYDEEDVSWIDLGQDTKTEIY